MENEIWKSIVGFENYYEISNMGRVKRKQGYVYAGSGRFRVQKEHISYGKNKDGYRETMITVMPYRKNHLIHRLVAAAFIPNPNNYPCVNHIDGNRANNHVENLEWCTIAMNNQHAHDTGLNKTRRGYKCKPQDHKSLRKAVNYFDVNGNFIQQFASSCEASRILGIRQSAISQAALSNVQRPRKYIFKYVQEEIIHVG